MAENIDNGFSENMIFGNNPKEETRWYAVYTKPRHEKIATEKLRKKNFEVFLPLKKEYHKWSDRKKYVETPLLKGYLFVNITLKQTLSVLETHGVVRFVMFKNEFAPIPDFQIRALRKFLEIDAVLKPSEYYQEGQVVEITHGLLKGIIGKVAQIKNESKFIISLDAIKLSYAVDTIQIDPAQIKHVSEKRIKELGIKTNSGV